MGILEKIKDIEAEIARTQKNKATEHHLGMLKAKLAKYPFENYFIFIVLLFYLFHCVVVIMGSLSLSLKKSFFYFV